MQACELMLSIMRIAAGLALLVACGATTPTPDRIAVDDEDDGVPFVDNANFTPKAFSVRTTGTGRPVIFIPGLACPGDVWEDTAEHFADTMESHMITPAGFGGVKSIKPPLAAKVRRDLVRYIRSRKLDRPFIVGHSMGGFIAYWVAITAPDLIGGVIVVDAGPALGSTDVETARAFRNRWAQGGDDEIPARIRARYTSMTINPKHVAPYLDAILKSDRQAIGDSIYEMIRTDLRPQLRAITAPLLLVVADGGLQYRYKAMAEPVADREVVVIPKAGHFVMLDNPDAFYDALGKFFDAN